MSVNFHRALVGQTVRCPLPFLFRFFVGRSPITWIEGDVIKGDVIEGDVIKEDVKIQRQDMQEVAE